MISGIGSVMRRLGHAVRMIAVESAASQPAAAALANGGPIAVRHVQSFVDGMGSTTVLKEMWPLVRQNVDAAVCVSFAQITDAIRMLAARHHVIAEAAGAADADVLAGLLNQLTAERADPEASGWRRLEARLGYDPDEAPEAVMHKLGQLEERFGGAAIEEAPTTIVYVHQKLAAPTTIVRWPLFTGLSR